MSGPGLRFITRVVAHDCMTLEPQRRPVFDQATSLEFENVELTASIPESILIVDYDDPGEGRVKMAVAQVADLLTVLKVTDAWHAAWRTSLRCYPTLMCVMPICVYIPHSVGLPQVLTGFCAFKKGQSPEEPHIRWLHRL